MRPIHEDLDAQIIGLEKRLHSPELRRDPSLAGALLSAEFRELGSSGRIWSREEVVKAIGSEVPLRIESRDYRCQLLTPELVLLTYTSRTLRDSAPAREALRSSLWRLEGGEWRALFHQGTPIPQP